MTAAPPARTRPARVRRSPRRLIGAVAISASSAVLLSGCFFIPLADGRSPFDDPFGPSHKDVAAHEPTLQTVLDAVVPDDWVATAGTATDNCEGACDLRLGISIAPSAAAVQALLDAGDPGDDPADDEFPPPEGDPERLDIPLPTEVLSQMLRASVPVAANAHLDLSVEGTCLPDDIVDATGDVYACTDLTDAITQLTGSTEESGRDGIFSWDYLGLRVHTSNVPVDEVLARLA